MIAVRCLLVHFNKQHRNSKALFKWHFADQSITKHYKCIAITKTTAIWQQTGLYCAHYLISMHRENHFTKYWTRTLVNVMPTAARTMPGLCSQCGFSVHKFCRSTSLDEASTIKAAPKRWNEQTDTHTQQHAYTTIFVFCFVHCGAHRKKNRKRGH